ncbi:thioredoxin family protein [Streptomyces sp. H10-C2]|uniref:thioredoxin family protein n=1 Tax=unclassified Streptomyces TaxID=2593676 RepID=UPI0024BA2938|nr:MULTISPECIES: thioredoxin family protein [unclassified Streptomyces]MDJ0341043.1 thioredoxin family protein [Streptomyces sp. PH10-H1]MDJ0369725.1 thioredoxin family protein [Streptomyces sp. H10-C2]
MIALTLLTQNDCGWCDRARRLLAEVVDDVPLQLTEIGLDTDTGRELAARHRLLFAPGLLHGDRLIAHGRLSARALRRELARIPQP